MCSSDLAKMAIISKLISRFSTISIKIPLGSFVEIDKLLKYIQKCTGPRIAKTVFKGKNKVGELKFPFQNSLKAEVILYHTSPRYIHDT